MADEVSEMDTQIQQTAEEMNLPVEYVAEVYKSEAEEKESGSAQASEPSRSSSSPAHAKPAAEPDFPESLVQRAQAFGLDHTRFRDREALQSQLDHFDRVLVQQQQQARAQAEQQRQYQEYQARLAQQQAQQAQQPQQLRPEDVFKFDFSDQYDEDEVKVFNSALERIRQFYEPHLQRLSQLESIVTQQFQAQQRQHVEETNAAFDNAVDELNVGLFGQGRYDTLAPEAQQARQQLMQTAAALATTYQQRGMNIPAMGDLVESAARVAFADELKKNEQAEFRRKLTDRSKRRMGGTARHRPDAARPFDGPAHKDPYLLGKYAEMLGEQDFR